MAKNALADIKTVLDHHIGRRVHLRANGGRRRIIEHVGILEETYPAVFTIKLDEPEQPVRRISFSYADVLTETVELTIFLDDRTLRVEKPR
ncbi:Veg family protein [Brockia lithotrophica]|uniref:Uncharacterized protein Veg n=1 Tax=Brockia lithotrophica TaxID=933949 RepID=A0A660L1X7_9BACL|nr:Veg family protein [Brockia lithotrophica]RKQ85638.1 uncharacterized protein Veg [Brockia lithotrophica]